MNERLSTNLRSLRALGLGAFALAAVGCRVAAAWSELSFDEIWSWMLARNSNSALEILLMQLDNNHILNTLVLYALGPDASALAYRLPAVAAASAGLAFGFLVARRWGAGVPVLILLGASHMLILYASEARGYAYLTGCTLAAWWALEWYLDQPWFWRRAAFSLACTLGFLAQLPFAFAYAGFFVYSLLRLRRQRHWIRNAVVLHAWPLAAMLVVYLFYRVGLMTGGGDRFPLAEVLVAALSLMTGGPQRGVAAYIAATVAAVLLAASLVSELRSDRARGALYLMAMLIAPVGVIVGSGFDVIYPRHFLVPMIFGYVAVGCQFARWFARGSYGRYAVTALLLAFVGCNAVPVARLIAGGRGQDRAMLFWIVEQTSGPVATISGDHDFRVAMTLTYHLKRNEAFFRNRGTQLDYFENSSVPPEWPARDEYPREGTEWRVLHSSSEWKTPPPPTIVDRYRNAYELVQVFPCSSISGWTWWVYRRT